MSKNEITKIDIALEVTLIDVDLQAGRITNEEADRRIDEIRKKYPKLFDQIIKEEK